MIEMTLRLNKTEEKVKTYLRQHLLIESGMHVCVCFSGGMDSAVLLRMLVHMRDVLQIRLSACHFNHMIRGEEADRDELFCKQLCKQLNVPIFCGRADVMALQNQTKLSLEEAARDVRYAWFCKLASEQGIDRMATAHHKSDQAETVLFRITRGTTVSGLAGIPSMRDRFIRPLLCLAKEEIEAYANAFSIEFQTDSSNLSEQYTRNYIRQTVIPSLERINPSATNAIVRLSGYASDDDRFITSFLPPYADIQDVSDLPMAIVRRTVARNFTLFSDKTLCYQHLDEICDALYAKIDKRIGLSEGMVAVIRQGCFYFEKCSPRIVPSIENGTLTEGITYCCEGRVRIIFCKNQADLIRHYLALCNNKNEIVYNLSTEILLSFEKICGMIRYRSRQQGDRVVLRGINRSVKKLFSEKKVLISLREMIPVFFDERGILCIPFVAVSDRAYCTCERASHFLRVDVINEHSRKVVEVL